MIRFLLAIFAICLISAPVAAQEDTGVFTFGNDSFLTGRSVSFAESGRDDLFMAGGTLRGTVDISGSMHAAGRSVKMTGAIGRDAYAAGMDVVLEGAVTGDAALAGNSVSVGDVGGDLRITGGQLVIEGDIGGYALLVGEEVRIDGVITGDAYLKSRNLEFADGARIDGRVIVFQDKDTPVNIPESVAPEDRIERRDVTKMKGVVPEIVGPRLWWNAFVNFLLGIVVLTLLASLIAAFIPETLAQLRRSLLERPFTNLFYGFLAESLVAGTAVVFALTLIGILLIPASLLFAFVVGFAGYVVAVYSVGVWLLMAFGQPEPAELRIRVLAAAVGALAVGVIALIPFFGWLVVLALVLTGVGAIVTKLFRPKFFATP